MTQPQQQSTNALLFLTIFNHASWSTLHVASRFLQVYAAPIPQNHNHILLPNVTKYVLLRKIKQTPQKGIFVHAICIYLIIYSSPLPKFFLQVTNNTFLHCGKIIRIGGITTIWRNQVKEGFQFLVITIIWVTKDPQSVPATNTQRRLGLGFQLEQ